MNRCGLNISVFFSLGKVFFVYSTRWAIASARMATDSATLSHFTAQASASDGRLRFFVGEERNVFMLCQIVCKFYNFYTRFDFWRFSRPSGLLMWRGPRPRSSSCCTWRSRRGLVRFRPAKKVKKSLQHILCNNLLWPVQKTKEDTIRLLIRNIPFFSTDN